MAPSAASKGWYYMATWLRATPGIGTGPVVTGLKVARYVAIKNQGNIGTTDDWLNICSPDMNKLTAL